jgi:DNA helicase IV
MDFIIKIVSAFSLRNQVAKLVWRLQGIRDLKNAIELKIREIEASNTLAKSDYFAELLEDNQKIIEFCESRDLLFFDKKLKEKLKSAPKEPGNLGKIKTEYIELSVSCLELISKLDKIINKKNEKLKSYFDALNIFDNELAELKGDYITNSQIIAIQHKYIDVYAFFTASDTGSLSKDTKKFLELYSSFYDLVRTWNENFVSKELERMESFFNNIDGKSLDRQQREAVVVDEDANLIVAGAGSGKTLTVSDKVKYLVEEKGIRPEEILLISYTRKAANEMEERIKNRLGIDVEVRTFHSLGMKIIASHSLVKPDVEEDPQKIIKEYFNKEFYDNPEQLKKMLEFFGYYLNIPKTIEDFNNLGEYYDHHKHLDLETLRSKYEEQKYINENTELLKKSQTTIKGEKVKSLEEVMIANFLFLNGVEYEYEKEYEHPTATEYYRQYKPDFYLPEYEVYIEHFGVNKHNRASWLNDVEEQKYLESMKWKREQHEANQTKLLETYSYYANEGILLERLRTLLFECGVQFKEIDIIDVFNSIYDIQNKNHFREFIDFVSKFINLFKSNGYEYNKLDKFIQELDKGNTFYYNRTKLFLEITKPIYLFYEERLKRDKKIDFNDMINQAKSLVRDEEKDFSYKYIIIDEYQDISVSRFELIKEIRMLTNAKVVCVGDDWQSIYRFAGADLNLFTNFEKYFGKSEFLKIERTYRNSQELIDIAGKFVMKNEKQIIKDLLSGKKNSKPIRILGFNNKDEIIRTLKHAIEEIVSEFGTDAEIMLLGRNNFDITILDGDRDFVIKKTKKDVYVLYKKYPDLNIYFLTAHRSKGLEANNVILINAANHMVGFPNMMADDPILSLVLTEKDAFWFAEERRLFYVAITRTKNTTYILTPDSRRSVFVTELIEEQKLDYDVINGITSISKNPKCPRCLQGSLTIRENGSNKSSFLGCSNYPFCEYTLNDVRVMDNQIVCPRCKGFMVLRSSSKGQFYGCSNYPRFCFQIVEIQDEKELV